MDNFSNFKSILKFLCFVIEWQGRRGRNGTELGLLAAETDNCCALRDNRVPAERVRDRVYGARHSRPPQYYLAYRNHTQ